VLEQEWYGTGLPSYLYNQLIERKLEVKSCSQSSGALIVTGGKSGSAGEGPQGAFT
jgi:hypothetical protein